MENFNEVYSSNHKRVLNYIARKINDLTVAEELTNDVFMKVHAHLHKFDERKASMPTWIMKFATNKIIDHFRKKKNQTLSLDATIGEDGKISLMDKVASPMNPHMKMVSNETLDIVQRELDALPVVYKDIANLYFNSQKSYDEISRILNIPLGTVKGQISRARTKLMTRLEPIR